MRGASRASYAELRDALDAVATGPRNSEQIGDQLFAVVALLDSEHGLRRALADGTKPADEKSGVVRQLLNGKVSTATEGLVADAAAARWATSGDFAGALEELAGLRLALTGPTSPDAKASLLDSLLGSKVSGPSLRLLTQVLTHPRGRSPQAVLDLAAGIAARRREQLIAVVRVAIELSDTQRQRLLATLTEAYGHGIHLNVVHDPAVLGGVSVQIGDELIDGTAASRLAEVRRKLAG